MDLIHRITNLPGPRGWVGFLAGLTLIGIGGVGLQQDIAWLAQPFYAWVWWGYILMLDSFSYWKRGDSLLTTRRHFFLPICIWSITFWFFFELLNARMQNWYYVGVFPAEEIIMGVLFTVFAFSTVFMGIFQTFDALNASGIWRSWKGRLRHFPRSLTYGLQVAGLVLGGLALVFPHYLAPLVWGSFTLVVDPWNYRRGTRSLLRDLEQGDFGLLARLLMAGLICGVVWESLNFFAPQKWIYTVRGLEGFKVFEMPLLGFLGFPALALDSMAAFALCSTWFLGNRSWEHPNDLIYELRLHPPASPRTFWTTAGLQVLFWAFVSAIATPVHVASLQIELRDLGLSVSEQQQLRDIGITRPRQFLNASRKAQPGYDLQQTLGWDEIRFITIRDRAKLYTFKGIGQSHGQLLESVGIRTPNDLVTWKAEDLHARLTALSGGHSFALVTPRLDFVRVWILAARDRDIILNSP